MLVMYDGASLSGSSASYKCVVINESTAARHPRSVAGSQRVVDFVASVAADFGVPAGDILLALQRHNGEETLLTEAAGAMSVEGLGEAPRAACRPY